MYSVLVWIWYPGYPWPSVTTQNFGYDQFPPVVNGWGTIQPVLDMAPPLLAEEEGPPTYKELNRGAIRTISLPHYSRHGQVGFATCRPDTPPSSTQDGLGHPVTPSRSFQYRIDFTICQGLRNRRYLLPGMTGHGHRPHAHLAIATQVGIHPITA
jgi:hypothetical protein